VGTEPTTEAEFRDLIREMVGQGIYPRHRAIVIRLGRSFETWAFGLSEMQIRVRREEVERAGYDWDLSRASRRLVQRKR
jgi:hypothetical protein